MKLYRFKSSEAREAFIDNFPAYNTDMANVLAKAGTFSFIQVASGFHAYKDNKKLVTTRSGDVYITPNEKADYFEEIKETELNNFDKAVKLVSSVVDIDKRTEAFIKLVRFELSNQRG